ncbi:MAG: OmpA family protein [Bacteroidetes bacterium]|nr:MAG: OmpA family protein [Bacteroidota bacterium]
MRYLLTIYILLFFVPLYFGQLSGVWQGIMIKDGSSNDQSTLVFANFEISDGKVSGNTRNEMYDTDMFAVKKIRGTSTQNKLSFSEFVIEKKKNNSKINWCNISADLIYDDSTGYLTGRYTSSDCKRNNGKIILYRSKGEFPKDEESALSQVWYSRFLIDLKKGYNAPEIREKERKNFVFQPIYFDYDKDELKQEYYPFLIKMVRVVDGHSDLRIKVTGHTDSDGSDAYNDDLSKRRAEALINFFVSHGLSKDRIVLDFKGEKEPIDSNNTPEGKQKNRRVDFSFI